MVSFPGRSGRRRRVLNEDVLSASSSHLVLRAASENLAASDSRYGEAAAVEHHPQITDFVPRRLRTIGLMLVCGVAVSAVAVGAHQLAINFVAEQSGDVSLADTLHLSQLDTWIGAVLLLVAGGACLIIQSIRRHRIDDVGGRYRIWRWATLACFVASANSVAGFHQLVAVALSQATHWTALREDAAWWLALSALPLGWIGLRTLLDVKESRMAATFMLFAAAMYGTGLAVYLNLVPGVAPGWQSNASSGAVLAGHWLLLAAAVSYARHVVLDAQGLIAERPAKSTLIKSNSDDDVRADSDKLNSRKAESSRATSAPKLQVHDPSPSREKSTPQIIPAKSQANTSDWVDGRRRERDRYQSEDVDDEDESSSGSRKLNKSELKQLRKLKARNRAA